MSTISDSAKFNKNSSYYQPIDNPQGNNNLLVNGYLTVLDSTLIQGNTDISGILTIGGQVSTNKNILCTGYTLIRNNVEPTTAGLLMQAQNDSDGNSSTTLYNYDNSFLSTGLKMKNGPTGVCTSRPSQLSAPIGAPLTGTFAGTGAVQNIAVPLITAGSYVQLYLLGTTGAVGANIGIPTLGAITTGTGFAVTASTLGIYGYTVFLA
jgi:hypothetical protein